MSAFRYRGGSQGRVRQLVHQRANQRAILNGPDLTKHLTTPEPEPLVKAPDRADWPAIQSTHPGWWQVHRVEQVATGLMRYVLIAECQSEDMAFRVVRQQLHQCRLTKWGDKRPAYFSPWPPKLCDPE